MEEPQIVGSGSWGAGEKRQLPSERELCEKAFGFGKVDSFFITGSNWLEQTWLKTGTQEWALRTLLLILKISCVVIHLFAPSAIQFYESVWHLSCHLRAAGHPKLTISQESKNRVSGLLNPEAGHECFSDSRTSHPIHCFSKHSLLSVKGPVLI